MLTILLLLSCILKASVSHLDLDRLTLVSWELYPPFWHVFYSYKQMKYNVWSSSLAQLLETSCHSSLMKPCNLWINWISISQNIWISELSFPCSHCTCYSCHEPWQWSTFQKTWSLFFFSEEHKATVTQIFPNIRKLWHIFPIKIFVRERINQPSYQQQCVQSYNSIAGASIYCIVKDKGNSGGLENGRHSSHFWKECEKNWPK